MSRDGPDGTGDDSRSVNAFRFPRHYLFRHYFRDEAAFEELKYFYNNQEYRFEVPRREFGDLRRSLGELGYTFLVVDDVAEYTVAVEKYTAHPDNIFKAAVYQESAGEFNCFVLKDDRTVQRALREGARPLTELDLDLSLSVG